MRIKSEKSVTKTGTPFVWLRVKTLEINGFELILASTYA